jgi:nitrate/nitrite transport system permease protein
MTAIDPTQLQAERRARLFTRINRLDGWFKVLGLSFLTPLLKAAAGDSPRSQAKQIWQLLGVPVLAILGFLLLWGNLAPRVETSLGAIPGPAQVWEQAVVLHAEHRAEQARKAEFLERQAQRNAELIAAGNADRVRERPYTGSPTYYAQIWTSVQTVFFGFLIATAVAVPLGIAAGLSPTTNAALNPLIQIFKRSALWRGFPSSPWWSRPSM